MELKLKLEEGVDMPQYETEGAAGFDIRAISVKKAYLGDTIRTSEKIELMQKAFLNNTLKLRAGERVLFGTGIYADIPSGTELQIRPRSGVSLKQGLIIPNAPGTIDSDYTGEICVIIQNNSPFLTEVSYNTRIAQAVLKDVIRPMLVKVGDISKETERADGGFGSTGK